MSEKHPQTHCPECEGLDRRDFVRALGGTAVSLAGLEAVARTPVLADAPATGAATPARNAKPAEALIRELFGGLSDDQKRQVVYAWNHAPGNNRLPMRSRMVNAPFARRIGDAYTRPQQELVQRILRSIASGEEGYTKLTRNGTFDGSRNLQGCGAYIFGDPTGRNQYAWVFQGHHITVRCDGNSEPGAAFGGPMYYGHSPDGYSQRNCFFYQTRAVMNVFDALTEAQRREAVVQGSPGEHEGSIQFRRDHPGIPASELTRDQRGLVETVMRQLLSPYRREDADEVMDIVRRNGGLERIHLAFYRDRGAPANERWHFWRLEGPGLVWNFRVLPHVHTYVNIALQQPTPRPQG